MALIFEARGTFLGVFHVGYAKVFCFSFSFWGSVRDLHIELGFLDIGLPVLLPPWRGRRIVAQNGYFDLDIDLIFLVSFVFPLVGEIRVRFGNDIMPLQM